MLISLDELERSHGLNVTGVLHVGAHAAEELLDYRRRRYSPIYWIEANPELVDKLKWKLRKHSDSCVINAVVSDISEEVDFHIANNSESSSILELGTHAKEHPEVVYEKSIPVMTATLDQLSTEHNFAQCNFWNLDIQGAELRALKGGAGLLDGVDYIYCEVNVNRLYKECALLPEIDEYLSGFGFKRYDTHITPHGWGDAFYIKDKV